LSDTSSAEDYIAVNIRIEIISVNFGDFFFFEAGMAYGVAGTYGDTVTTAVAQISIHRLGFPVNCTPHTHDAITDAEHTFTAFFLMFFN
jgi:hypothetical protein